MRLETRSLVSEYLDRVSYSMKSEDRTDGWSFNIDVYFVY